MKIVPLHIVLLDDTMLFAGGLSNYVSKRFGKKANVFVFSDLESCLKHIDKSAVVFIFDYCPEDRFDDSEKRLNYFEAIKKQSPETEVILITSGEAVPYAAEKMERIVSKYIIRADRSLRGLLPMIDETIRQSFQILTLPVRKIFREFTVNKYIMLFAVVFSAVGLVVFTGPMLWNYLFN